MTDIQKITIREFQRGFNKLKGSDWDVYRGRGMTDKVGAWRRIEGLEKAQSNDGHSVSDTDLSDADACRTDIDGHSGNNDGQGEDIVTQKDNGIKCTVVGCKNTEENGWVIWGYKDERGIGRRICEVCKEKYEGGLKNYQLTKLTDEESN